MAAERILVVDDSEVTLDVLERNLTSRGFHVVCASGAHMALDLLDAGHFDLLITDLKMPEMNGMELLRLARERRHDLPTMIITGYATIPGAVEAVKGGVLEYLAKPFTKGELCEAVQRVMEQARKIRAAGGQPQREPRKRFGLIGRAPAMTPVFAAMEGAAAEQNAPVLFIGETGTGKRAAARSLASGKPFIAEECANISNDLIERSRGGVLYLSHLDLASKEELDLIAAALKKKQKTASRIIAGASTGIMSGSFPKNIYSVFAPHTIFMPPLRERKEDAPRILLNVARRVLPNPFPCWPIFSAELLNALQRHTWPGNVAELIDTAGELLSRFKNRALEIADLPERFKQLAAEPSPTASLEEVETAHIRKVLQSAGGNKSRAAEILKITRKTLGQKLKNRE
jgi:two-component system, NtrC family, response regulator HydG